MTVGRRVAIRHSRMRTSSTLYVDFNYKKLTFKNSICSNHKGIFFNIKQCNQESEQKHLNSVTFICTPAYSSLDTMCSVAIVEKPQDETVIATQREKTRKRITFTLYNGPSLSHRGPESSIASNTIDESSIKSAYWCVGCSED